MKSSSDHINHNSEKQSGNQKARLAMRKIVDAIQSKKDPDLSELEEGGALFHLREELLLLLETFNTQSVEANKLSEKYDFIARVAEENPNPVLRFSIDDKTYTHLNKAGKKLLSSFSEDDIKEIQSSWFKKIDQAWKNKRTYRRELHSSRQDIIFMCTIVPIIEYRYVNVYATEITAIKSAEKEIRKLSFAIDESNNAVLIADRNGYIQWVNKGFERVTGYALNDIKGTKGEILRKGKHTGLSDDSMFYKKVLESGQSVSYESRNYRKNGTDYWTLSTLTPLLNENKELVSIIAVDSDITDKKENEQELYEAKIQAEKSAKAKEVFLANMSHEMRTPMNAIMGIIQLLKETDVTGEQREYLRSMDFASENLLRIINDILDLSKIESGKMSIEKVPFSIRELMRDLVNSIEHRSKEKGVDLKTTISEEVPETVVGDPVRLNQIILNLLSNSIKFTENGSISLTVKVDEKDTRTAHISFSVSDTGIGIPDSMLDQIFEAFEQVERVDKAKYGGTGLGLSIVRRLTDLHSGDIYVTSKENQGTNFCVVLPYEYKAIGSPDPVPGEKYYHSELLVEKRALLVEDNALNQMVASKFLMSFGFIVDIANDGIEALEKLKADTFDLVLMDLQMPNMDGYQTSRKIRSGSNNTDIPIVAMTAHAIRGEEIKCFEAGMNDYISKPIKKGVLFEKLKDLFFTIQDTHRG